MAAAAPPPTHARSPLSSERKQKIARRISVGILVIIGGFLGLGIASGSFNAITTPVAYLLPAALFCFATFVGFVDEPLTVPARLQLMLYAGAVLAGLAFAWIASLIDNSYVWLVSFIVIASGFKAIAAKLIKNQHAQHK